MPTPLGHALGAFAAGWMIAGPPGSDSASGSPPAATQRASLAANHQPATGGCQRGWARAALFMAIGIAADLDLVFGVHSAYTHSIGAAAVVGALVAAVSRKQRLLVGLAAAAAYLSHVAFDLLSQDMSIPLGVMALWPFSAEHFHLGLDVFPATDRRYWLPGFWLRDLYAVVWEILLVGPLAAGAWWVRRRRVTDHYE